MARATPQKQEVLPLDVQASEAERLLQLEIKIKSTKAMIAFNNHVLNRATNLGISEFQIYEGFAGKKGKEIYVNRFDFCFFNKKFRVFGAAKSRKDARHKAAGATMDKLLDIYPKLFMPKYLVGLPNFRGHCFLIPALVPMFWDKELVQTICLLDCDLPEFSNLAWIKIFKEIFLAYRQVSFVGQYPDYLLPRGIEKKYPELYPNIETSSVQYPPGKKAVLEVDRRLIRLCMSLRDHVSRDYNTPSGWHSMTYQHIMAVIKEEFTQAGKESPMQLAFGIDFNYNYSCTSCTEIRLKAGYSDCYLFIDAQPNDVVKSIQDYFDFPEFLVRAQGEPKCRRFKNGKICLGDYKRVGTFKITKAPNTLVFIVRGERNWANFDDNISIPDELKIETEQGPEIYVCFAKSFQIETWKFKKPDGSEEVILRDAPHPENYEQDGAHVFLLVKTEKGWIEINNDSLFIPLKTYTKVQPFQLIFFCKKSQMCLPEVNENYIEK